MPNSGPSNVVVKPPMPSGVFVVSMTTSSNLDGIMPYNAGKKSPCSSFSSNSSSASSSKSSSSAGLASPSLAPAVSPSTQLAAAASAVQLTLNSSSNTTSTSSSASIYLEPKQSGNKWAKSQSINSNMHTMLSPSAAVTSNSSFSNKSSPKSVSSADTVVIRNNGGGANKTKKSIEIDGLYHFFAILTGRKLRLLQKNYKYKCISLTLVYFQ